MARGKKRAAAASAEEDAVVDAAAEMLPMVQRTLRFFGGGAGIDRPRRNNPGVPTSPSHIAVLEPPSAAMYRPPALAAPERVVFTRLGERWRTPTGGVEGEKVPEALVATTSSSSDLTNVVSDPADDDDRGTPTAAPPTLDPISMPLRRGPRRKMRPFTTPVGAALTIARERDNPADARALRCFEADGNGNAAVDGESLGYVPRVVSAHVSPLIDAGLVTVTGRVVRCAMNDAVDGGGEDVDVEIELVATASNAADATATEKAAASWRAAATAAASSSDALPDKLRARLWEIIDGVVESSRRNQNQNQSLLTSRDAIVIEDLRLCSAPAQALAIRLSRRKTTWTRARSLRGKFREVPDADAALRELWERGLLVNGDDGGDVDGDDDESIADAEGRLRLLTPAQLSAAAKRLLPGPPGVFSATERKRGGASKASLVSELLSTVAPARVVDAWRAVRREDGEDGEDDAVVRLTPALTRAFRTALFLAYCRPSDVGELSMEDLGMVRYVKPPPIEKDDDDAAASVPPLFATRADLDAYLDAVAESAAVDAAVDAGDEAGALRLSRRALAPLLIGAAPARARRDDVDVDGRQTMPSYLRRFDPAHVRARTATTAVGLLERAGEHAAATTALLSLLSGDVCPEKRGAWYDRASTNFNTHLGKPAYASEMLDHALADPWVRVGDRVALLRRAARLAKKTKNWRVAVAAWREDAHWDAPVERIDARAMNADAREKNKYVNVVEEDDDDGGLEDDLFSRPQGAVGGECVVSVEALALAHYSVAANGGWRGAHCETSLWTTLFGLLFADVIFCGGVPGTFRGPFQSAPLDFDTDAFAPARATRLAAALRDIRGGAARTRLSAAWREHRGAAIAGVSWTLMSLDDLCDVAEGIGRDALASMMGLLAEDRRGWVGGAPDLILWRRRGSGAGARAEVKCVEVKSANDRLSDQQRAWLLALRDAGVDVVVCKVM